MKVAFVGLGVMGFPMAGHLARAGLEVSVFNRSPAKAQAWIEKHVGRAGDTLHHATHGAELVGEVVQYEDTYRLAYIRGPEGIIVGLSEQLKQ